MAEPESEDRSDGGGSPGGPPAKRPRNYAKAVRQQQQQQQQQTQSPFQTAPLVTRSPLGNALTFDLRFVEKSLEDCAEEVDNAYGDKIVPINYLPSQSHGSASTRPSDEGMSIDEEGRDENGGGGEPDDMQL